MTTMYKSVTLRCWPIDPKTEDILSRAFIQVRGFMTTSLTEFRKGLYHASKDNDTELPMRTVALLAKRFGDTVLKNEVIPLDNKTYKIVKINGYYNIIVKILGNQQTQDYDRVTLPISRSDNDYYGDIIENNAYGAVLYKQGNNTFLTISIPIEMRCQKKLPAVFIGIDLNMQKDAVSLYNPQTSLFERNLFFDRRPLSESFDRLQLRLSRVTKGMKKTDWTDGMREMVNDLYKRRSSVVTNSHGNFISNLLNLAESYIDKQNVIFVLEDLKGITKRVSGSKSFNTWLHAKWCFGRFRELLETKGFPVIDVYPFLTSKTCHHCGERGYAYGQRARLFKCGACGLMDFNRDLNAARNIAMRGFKRLSPQ